MNQETTSKADNEVQTRHVEFMEQKQASDLQMEMEASSDQSLVKKVKLMLGNHCIQVVGQDKSKVVFSVDDFMGAEFESTTKVDQYLIQEGVASLALYYAQIVKKKVKIIHKLVYSKDGDQLQSFREKCVEAFYCRVQSPSAPVDGAPRKRFLFFVSPMSGKGQALKYYDSYKKYYE